MIGALTMSRIVTDPEFRAEEILKEAEMSQLLADDLRSQQLPRSFARVGRIDRGRGELRVEDQCDRRCSPAPFSNLGARRCCRVKGHERYGD